jgi:hypothetical protein
MMCVVQLLLFLELEHLGRAFGQDIPDIAEHRMVIFDVKGAAHEQIGRMRRGQRQSRMQGAVTVGRTVDANHETSPCQRFVAANDHDILLDVPHGTSGDSSQTRQRLPADSVRPHDHQVVLPAGGSGQFFLFFLPHFDSPMPVQPDILPPALTAIVIGRGIGIESDQARQPAAPLIGLFGDLFVMDAFQELPSEGDAGMEAALLQLVEKGIGNELQPLLDELVVHLALMFQFLGRLELGRQARLQLTEPHVMQARGIDVIAGDAAAALAAYLDGPVYGPIGIT